MSGSLVSVKGVGDADEDHVHFLHALVVILGAEEAVLHHRAQQGGIDVVDVVLAPVEGIDLVLVHIDTDGREALRGILHRQRQTDIAQSHHTDGDVLRGDFLFECHGESKLMSVSG
jgi:hypothetical protein